MKCVAATHNPGKLEELRFIFRDWPFEIISLGEAGLAHIEMVEDGTTYRDNALIKARAIAGKTSLPVLSDDSGMEVFSLDGAPGIYSARFGGEDLPFPEKRKKMIQLLESCDDRRASFHSAIAFILGEKEFIGEASVEGLITKRERGEWGFGYDSIFELPDGRTFAEYPFEEKQRISHRALAALDLKEKVMRDKDTGLF